MEYCLLGGKVDILSLDAVTTEVVIVFFLVRGVTFLLDFNLATRDGLNETGILLFLIYGLRSQGEVVLSTLIIDAIEFGDGAVRTDDLAVAEEPPHLPECHREALFALLGFDFARVQFVPRLEV